MSKILSILFAITFSLIHNQLIYANPLSDTCIVLQIKQTIPTANDDVEERADGSMYLNSSDLELIEDDSDNHPTNLTGIRFSNTGIPQGATITNAYIQFTADE